MSEPSTPAKLKPILLHMGTLVPGGSERIPMKAPIPAGLSPLVVNVRVGDGGRVALVTWDPTFVEIANEGTGPASYMIFAGTPAMHRAVDAAAKVLALAAQVRRDLARKDTPQ